ncbi:hypothetical protein [Actinophytocola sp. NPDC049390]|uniref:hypothetical protein n=1 Tax=Actinophytocola sp. NPDC049390 TaxID=3363894 RepID=UPI0027C44065|nr:hypothetical protein [Actinomycetota bacterium]
MADGYEVDPAALRAASSGFYTGAAAVDQAAARLSVAQLVPGALGEVDAAYELASAFAEFVGEHGDDLRKGASWVNDAGDGLVENADEYTRKDVFPYGRP